MTITADRRVLIIGARCQSCVDLAREMGYGKHSRNLIMACNARPLPHGIRLGPYDLVLHAWNEGDGLMSEELRQQVRVLEALREAAQ